MKTRTLQRDKVNLITLGCSKNMVDSEVLAAQLQHNDYAVAHNLEGEDDDANIVGRPRESKQEAIIFVLTVMLVFVLHLVSDYFTQLLNK